MNAMAYALEGPKWNATTVTWSFAGNNGGTASTKASVEQAFNEWSQASGLTFVEVADSASSSIRISYGNLNPVVTGEIGSTTYTYSGNSLMSVAIQLEDPAVTPLDASGIYTGWSASFHQLALHEIGHAIGMGHDTSDTSAVMSEMATAANRALARDDIAGIRSVYQDQWTYENGVATPFQGKVAGQVAVHNGTTGGTDTMTSTADTSDVAWISSEWLGPATQGVSAIASTPNAFIVLGAGDDALVLQHGNNIVYAGGGSNILQSGDGNDVFFLDARASTASWNMLGNFHAGDRATIWGITPGVTKTTWQPNQMGADGYKGATVLIDGKGDGTINNAITFTDMSVSRAQSLSYAYGQSGGLNYMIITDTG